MRVTIEIASGDTRACNVVGIVMGVSGGLLGSAADHRTPQLVPPHRFRSCAQSLKPPEGHSVSIVSPLR